MTTATTIDLLERTAKPAFLRKYPGTILLLAVLAIIAYGGAALTPTLLGDEWGFLGSYIDFGGPLCPDWASVARPFGGCWTASLYRIVGTNMHGFHAAGILMSFLSALLLLIALDILLPGQAAYNGAVAALYLVFPADMTRTWLAGMVTFGTALFLLATCFMALFWRDGRWWAWAASMAIVIFSLNTYEITLGAIIALSGLAFLFGRHRTWTQRLGLLAPAILSTAFAAWRWWWQQSAGQAFGHNTSNVTFSVADLFERLWFGAGYTLRVAWTDTAMNLLPAAPESERVALVLGPAILIGLIGLAMLIGYLATRDRERPEAGQAARRAGNGELARAAAVGLVLLAAGYVPIILAIFPGTEYTASRAHHLPSVGAAMVFCAVLFGIAGWLGRSPARARGMALAGLAPLLLLGIAGQLMAQRQTREAWADQRLIWHSLFEQAPDIVDGTHVLIMLNGYGTPAKGPRPFISGPWGASNAIQLLYGKKDVTASYAAAWPPRVLSIDGENLVLNNGGRREFPADETLVFVFNRADNELVRIEELEKDGQVLPLGTVRIIDTPAAQSEWRWLVAGE